MGKLATTNELIQIYHNPRCSKSRESLQLLQDTGCSIEIIEYLKETPSKETIRHLVTLLGIQPIELVRKGEEEYKTHFAGKTLSDEEWFDALHSYPKLIERPIVIKGNKAVIGRPPSIVKDIL